MKLGDVLRKERERSKLSIEDVSTGLGVDADEYRQLESGSSAIEDWGPSLGQIAIKLSTPTSRLISETGRSSGANKQDGQCGKLIRGHRERKDLSRDEFAKQLGWPVDKVIAIEQGESPLETYAPLLLRFAETIDQPIFNLFYPCGLPLEKLEDYP